MCGRYYIESDDVQAELRQIIEDIQRRKKDAESPRGVKTQGEIYPTDRVPIIANNRDLQPAAFVMQWGYTLTNGKIVINARSETASEKPLFKDGMLQRRCLIPASYYFEWEKHEKEKTKYAIWPSHAPMFYMAGVYRSQSGNPVFSILTCEPASNIAFIHNRMPVILPPDMKSDWLNPKWNADEMINRAVMELQYKKA